MPDTPKSSPILRLDKSLLSAKDLARVRDNFSAVVFHGTNLWLGGDEGTLIDRMTQQQDGNFGAHQRFDLDPLLKLPDGTKSEIDIEGLDVSGGCLWVIGSHSLKRKKPEKDETPAKNMERLSDISADGNRFTLARVPLTSGTDPQPVAQAGGLSAARLKGDLRGNALSNALKNDPHLGLFMPRMAGGKLVGVPSKDNGLDIEGLAVSGGRLFIGMRGPVLRGWAVVLEIRVADSSNGLLTLDPGGGAGKPYRKHFLQLGGLGVRDLIVEGQDLYILAGPTMDLDGPVFIYCWQNALDQNADSMTAQKELKKMVVVPFGNGTDHAEGITLLADPHSVLVCYDTPDKTRIDGPDEDGVRADVFEL